MFLFNLSVIIIFWYGGHEVIATHLTIGELVACYFYAQNIASGMGSLTRLYESFNSAAGASRYLFKILDQTPAIQVKGSPKKLSFVKGHISFRKVSFSYKSSPRVLNSINFEVKPKENIAIMGLNGAGKTTIFNLILRFLTQIQVKY